MPSGTWTGCIKQYRSGAFNFGQDPTFGGEKSPATTYTDANGIGAFYYQPPDGALALCTANLPPSVIEDPADYFKAVIWTGDGTGTSRTISDVGFAADLIWTKKRSAGGAGDAWHQIYDTVRGYNSSLNSNTTNSESTSFDNSDNHGYLDLFTSDGFRFTNGSDASWPRHYYNESGETYVAWCWKAGGNSNTFNINGTGYSTYSALQTANTSLPASSTSGMIVPSGMSINTDAGFSIVKWQASNGSDKTVPHGLSNSLDMIITKNLDTGTYGWHVSHVGLTTNHNLLLNTPDESWNAATGGWVEVGTDGVFNIKNGTVGTNTNNGTDNYIAYCWHSVEGYSKFGSYVGNSSTDGPFVYTGFRPAFVMVKRTAVDSWFILDNERNESNPVNSYLMAHSPSQEDPNNSTVDFDFISNGLKIRATTSGLNATGSTYIYMAFAEQPFNFTNSR